MRCCSLRTGARKIVVGVRLSNGKTFRGFPYNYIAAPFTHASRMLTSQRLIRSRVYINFPSYSTHYRGAMKTRSAQLITAPTRSLQNVQPSAGRCGIYLYARVSARPSFSSSFVPRTDHKARPTAAEESALH